ncbi:hypothetical protein CN419_27825 [Bacillus cereus]|uniref:hypothetical protein n=1 Tax=Bacillus cereus group TaxID=86661 RepID=UPI000353495D|nr:MULTISPECIES: hypothetical protein [Bacillus cereus group]EPF08347.1 hypothetical protein ICA_05744 [Bacillus cereus BAG1O-3]MDR4415796.1 hypothetical protein [Bacillus thuringiensis]PEV23414.1 hypothetical protein CN419_27825 [Bacillus cereus]
MKLLKGNTITLSGIPDADDQTQLLKSLSGGPVVSFTIETTNPPSKAICINGMKHDGKDCYVSIYNFSGGSVNVNVTGWEIPNTLIEG